MKKNRGCLMNQVIASKVYSMKHDYNNDYAIKLTADSPEYIVGIFDDGKFMIGRAVNEDESTHAHRMALEKAICVRKKVYRNSYGAMEFFWK